MQINWSIILTSFIAIFSLTAESGKFGSSKIQTTQTQPVEKKNSGSFKTSDSKQPSVAIPKVSEEEKVATYFYPGLIQNINGKWIGSDNLLNLKNNIGVYAEISQPEGLNLNFDSNELVKLVKELWQNSSLNPKIVASVDAPPLPFFKIQLLIYPVQDGYAACCQGSLFEQVNLKRVQLNSQMALQAITWQKTTLLVTPQSQLYQNVKKSVEDLAQIFLNTHTAFQR